MSSINDSDCLQAYFEQQNDTEAASIVAAVMALLPSHIHTDETEAELEAETEDIDTQEDAEQDQLMEYIDELNLHVAALETDLLTKESEIAALKEVASKWRSRALEIESNYHQLDIQSRRKLKSMQKRHEQSLEEKDNMIVYLKNKVDYLIATQQQYQDSVESEIYDGESDTDEQEWSSLTDNYQKELQPGAILDSIQDTMRAIEQELNFHALQSTAYNEPQPNLQDHTGPVDFGLSSSTIVDCSMTEKANKKKSFMHRMIKRGFSNNVPAANDVLVPETLLKKNKADAKAAEAAAAKKAELRKASTEQTMKIRVIEENS
ncbi:hypothetical protein A0J61_02577 [Choanephora cucurbitarum]|uniref:Uncharacterized protein n=1 Tax=Choanephora cucurbitarum TaxID=101091 RepID=A0A1C7NK64_9FUNG|nr:hypothetical protein A0J61_02577 [Choanephora cucurbitarum]